MRYLATYCQFDFSHSAPVHTQSLIKCLIKNMQSILNEQRSSLSAGHFYLGQGGFRLSKFYGWAKMIDELTKFLHLKVLINSQVEVDCHHS